MASTKVSFKNLKNNDNGQLSAALLGGKTVVSKNTGFEKIPVEKVLDDPKGDFVDLFPFSEEAALAIADSMSAKGYDKTQVIHVARIIEEPETMDNPIRIDGAHRTWAAKKAGIDEIPVYVHTFETRTEALIYAYELQLNRRNLAPHEKISALQKLDQLKNPGRKKDDAEESTGKSAAALAQALNEKTRTVERMRRITKFGCQEIIDEVQKGKDNGGLSIPAAEKLISEIEKFCDESTIDGLKNGSITIDEAKQIIAEKKEKQNNIKDNVETSFLEEDEDNEDFSDSLDDNSGNPRGLNFNHSDGIERPTNKISPEEDSERTRERRQAYLNGLSDGFYKALVFCCSEFSKGKSAEEVYKDERVADLSPCAIEKFVLPEDAEELISRW